MRGKKGTRSEGNEVYQKGEGVVVSTDEGSGWGGNQALGKIRDRE